jgi:hypothetical protein
MGSEMFKPVEIGVGRNGNRALGIETVADSRTRTGLRFSCAAYSLDTLESKLPAVMSAHADRIPGPGIFLSVHNYVRHFGFSP